MRNLLVVVMVAAAATSIAGQAPATQDQPQRPEVQGPTFRTGVEVITVDVGVVDNRGRPVEDLRAPDFAVRIDGMPRRVVSAELVRFDVEAARRQPAQPFETHFTTNLSPRNGRLIVIAVDQLGIRVGAARGLLQTAARFLESLSPADRVAFVAYPAPGIFVDFTNDRLRLRQAMEGIVGNQTRVVGKLNIGLYEAIRIIDRSDGLVFDTVVARECRNMRGVTLEFCQREVLSESAMMVRGVRQSAIDSLNGLTALMDQLASVEGPKSLILLSEGIVLEGPDQLNIAINAAARARVSVNVLAMDVERDDITIAQMRPTASEDRDLQMFGLRSLAAGARGEIYNIIGTGQSIFERLSSELAAYYLVGVEEAPGDRNSIAHRIDVEVKRSGVSIRSRRAFVLASATAASRRSPQDVLADILKSPFGVAELPLRLTTFARQDATGDRVRLMLAADIGQPGSEAQEVSVAYALIDGRGVVVSSGGERRALTPSAASGEGTLEYLGEIVVAPGAYTLRLAVVDQQGRRGGVVREINAWKLGGEEFALGDLMIGNVTSGRDQQVRPAVEPRISTDIGAYLEFYSTSPVVLAGTTVTFEIAEDENGPALLSGQARLDDGDRPTFRAATGVLSPALLPAGRYFARARVIRNGEVGGVLARPFILERRAAAAPDAVVVERPVLVMTNAAAFDAKAALARETIAGMLDTLEKASPALKDAIGAARAGRYSLAAVEALAAGDQTAAAFLKGLDWYAQGQFAQATTQLQIAAGPRREFFPGAFYLGASLAAAGRDREAAGVWQLAIGSEPRPSLAYALFADARFRDGQPGSVIDVLKSAYDRTPADDSIARRLATAYLLTERYVEAIPVLDGYLARNAADQDALLAAVFAQYQITSRDRLPLSTADVAKLTRYVRAFRGDNLPLLEKYLETLRGN